MSNAYGLNNKIARRYEQSIKLFDSEFAGRPEHERVNLLYIVLGDCELAREYDWKRGQKSRQADRDAIKESKIAAKYAREFAKFCRAFPFQACLPVVAGILKSGVHLRIKEDQTSINDGAALGAGQSIRLANLLTVIADEIDAGKLLAKRGPVMHRTQHGPLNFNNPIENNAALPEPATALAIYLSFLFRKDNMGQVFFQAGERIPSTGKPRWKLVNQLVCDALSVSGDFKDRASKVLGRNADLEIIGYY